MIDQTVLGYSEQLKALGIENEVVGHIETRKVSEVLDDLKLEFSDCVPTLIMKGDGRYLAIVIRGDTKADFKKIKQILGISDLRFTTPEEFTEFTGLSVGAARIYIPNAVTLIDLKVLEKEYCDGRFRKIQL